MRNPWTIHTSRQNSLVVSVWRGERPRRAVTSPSPQAASWPISPEPANLGRPSPRAEKHSADLTTKPQTGKPRSPAPAAGANPTIVRSSLASASTVPNNCTSRMLKKSASFVLASFRPSTYPRGYASGSSLAAALLDGLFEHPALYSPAVPDVTTSEVLACPPSFPPTASHVYC